MTCDWITIMTMIGTGIAVVGFIYGILRNFKQDINTHIDRINTHIDRLESRMNRMEEKMDAHNARIDHLYSMFLEVQREGQKQFYDLLNAQKNPKTNP